MKKWEFKEWLIVIGFVLAAVFLFLLVAKSASANRSAACGATLPDTAPTSPEGYPVNPSCAPEDTGTLTPPVAQTPMSQNIVTGDKPVESVHKCE